MIFPPTSLLLLHHQPPVTRPVYDIPPVMEPSPRWPLLQALAARIARTPPARADRRGAPLSSHATETASEHGMTSGRTEPARSAGHAQSHRRRR
jgi:hypothetical protein